MTQFRRLILLHARTLAGRPRIPQLLQHRTNMCRRAKRSDEMPNHKLVCFLSRLTLACRDRFAVRQSVVLCHG